MLQNPWVKTDDYTLSLDYLNVLIGSQKYDLIKKSIDVRVVGFGGTDEAVKPWRFYFIYTLMNNFSPDVRASYHNSSNPGETKIGFFCTDVDNKILQQGNKNIGKLGDTLVSTLDNNTFIEQNGPGWLLCDGRDVSTSYYTVVTSNTHLPNIPTDELGQRTWIKVCGKHP